MGARPGSDGISGVHCHMTNSLNTPIEALEYAYPLRVRSYGYRKSSGGEGRFRGGDGLVRDIELLADSQVTLICERRKFQPYGLAGGMPGASGSQALVDSDGSMRLLPSKCSVQVQKGSRIRIETPGGGGWGEPLAPGTESDAGRTDH